MLSAGHYYKLRVSRISHFGLYLTAEEEDEVLLPNRYVSLEDKVGDELEVFVYCDSEDRLIATTDRPLAAVGESAYLKVVDKTIHGAFLDWGLKAKDLFLPNGNMQGRVEVGRSYIVFLYNDHITGRVVATMRLNGFVSNRELTLKPHDETDILVASWNKIGYRVILNNRHWGMLYHNQLFSSVQIGDRLRGYVSRITEDHRVDVTLQQQGYDEVKKSAARLIALLRQEGGVLPLWDESSPEEVAHLIGMSKKVFKRSTGLLMKQGRITMQEGRIILTAEETDCNHTHS